MKPSKPIMVDETTGVSTLASFVEYDVPDAAPLPVVRRSDLERFVTCPAQARFVETGRVLTTGRAAAVGQAVHDAFANATDEYVQAAGALGAADIADTLRGGLLTSRPDIQPEVLDAAGHCVWPWSKFINTLNPANIKKYDGGKGARSGQLAWDIAGICRITAEIDLLYAGQSKRVLHAVDYKSGHTSFNVSTIYQSFQFQCHAWLILNNYEEVDEFEVRIWRTRTNDLSPPVTFSREDFSDFDYLMNSAAMLWAQYRDAKPETCATHETAEGCKICPARHLCPAVPPSAVDADPEGFVRALWALSCRVDGMEHELRGYVERTKRDVVTSDGLAFGYEKPKAEKKAEAVLYSTTPKQPKRRQ